MQEHILIRFFAWAENSCTCDTTRNSFVSSALGDDFLARLVHLHQTIKPWLGTLKDAMWQWRNYYGIIIIKQGTDVCNDYRLQFRPKCEHTLKPFNYKNKHDISKEVSFKLKTIDCYTYELVYSLETRGQHWKLHWHLQGHAVIYTSSR